jgi:hypothetical protein
VLVLFGLVLNVLLIRTAAITAKRFVNSPVPPARPQATGTWSQVFKVALLRLVMVVIIQLALFETIEQVSKPWKESTQELWGMALAVATLGGLAWASWPGYQLKRSWLFWAGGILASSLLLLGLDNYYAWHLRPNLGLYRESEWVADHPGFQKQLRASIEKNLWRKPAACPPGETVNPAAPGRATSPQFGPTSEAVLKSPAVTPGHQTTELLDFDTGAWATSATFGANDRETHAWIRSNRVDVLGVVERGQIAVLCMDMVVVPAVSNGWDQATAQNVMTNWPLNQGEPNKITAISPLTDKTDVWYFLTREGSRGVLQIFGQNENPLGVKIRYKLVSASGPTTATPAKTSAQSSESLDWESALQFNLKWGTERILKATVKGSLLTRRQIETAFAEMKTIMHMANDRKYTLDAGGRQLTGASDDFGGRREKFWTAA